MNARQIALPPDAHHRPLPLGIVSCNSPQRAAGFIPAVSGTTALAAENLSCALPESQFRHGQKTESGVVRGERDCAGINPATRLGEPMCTDRCPLREGRSEGRSTLGVGRSMFDVLRDRPPKRGRAGRPGSAVRVLSPAGASLRSSPGHPLLRLSDPLLTRYHLSVVVALLLFSASPAFAQRETRIRSLPETPLPFVTTCVAPAARMAAVSDVAGMLAVAHRPKSPAHLSIFRLDAQGQMAAGEPAPLTLPKPAALGDRPNQVLGLACHPRFPLLYIWQDVPPNDPPTTAIDPAQSAEFDHLLVYSLEETPPRLLLATARGPDFHCGAVVGGFALDGAAARLYVPNMQRPGPMKNMVPAVGWLNIAPDGLPALVDANAAPATHAAAAPATANPAPAPPLAPPEAAASRAARLPVLEAAKAPGAAQTLSKFLESAPTTFSDWPSPFSYAPFNDDAVLTASFSGPVSWVLSDRLGRFGYFFLHPYLAYRYRLVAHPRQPSAYVITVAYDGRIVRLEHAEGYFTLTPQAVLIDNAVIHSPPLVLVKTNQLAVGTAGRICLVDLDTEGRLQGKGVQMTVNNPQIEALAWSERFGRLYVPVEKTP